MILGEYFEKKAYELGFKVGKTEAQNELFKVIKDRDDKIIQLENQIENLKKVYYASWSIDKSKVLSVDADGMVKLGDNKLTKQELAILKTEVKSFKNFSYWTIVMETIKQKAVEKAVIQSNVGGLYDENLELLAGKMMIHNLGIIKSIADLIEKSS